MKLYFPLMAAGACIFLLSGVSCTKTAKETSALSSPVVKRITINPGDTLSESLRETALSPESQSEIVLNFGKVFNLRRCRAGDSYEITVDETAGWKEFRYFPPGLDYYLLARSSGSAVTSMKKTREARRVLLSARGELRTSLWDSMAAQKVNPEIIVSFADIFAWQIDFLTEPRVGDTYRLIYEQYVTDNGTVVNQQILGAQYGASGDTYTAFLYTPTNGQKEYFTPEGRSMRSAFLRAPLQFRRISSYFTRRRYHPILKYFRPHLGIDYAAPSGTPVSTIGEGTIIYAGWKGGFGKYIGVRHPNGFCSYYGHLSRIGKGIRTGAHVRQGQVIGYVGSTGLSSGPHLDFRVTKNGTFINFLKLKFPSATTLAGHEKALFEDFKKSIYTQLASIH